MNAMEPNAQSDQQAPKPRSSIGGVLGIILILVLIVVGAFYVWGERLAENEALTPAEQEMIESIETQDESSEASDIEADLAAEDPDQFDEDFDEAYAQLDAAFEE